MIKEAGNLGQLRKDAGMRDEYFTIKETSRLLNLEESWVRRMVAKGKLRGRKWGNTWMVEAGSVRNFGKRPVRNYNEDYPPK